MVPSQICLNIIIINSDILLSVKVFEDFVKSSQAIGRFWLPNLWFDSWLGEFSEISISSLRFHEEILEIRKKCKI